MTDAPIGSNGRARSMPRRRRGVASRPARAAPAASADARPGAADLRGLLRAARRSRVRRRSGHRRRPRAARAACRSWSSAIRREPTPSRTSCATSARRIPRGSARRSGSCCWPTSSGCRSSPSSTRPAPFPVRPPRSAGRREAIASSIKLMTGLQVPIVVIVLGEGGSGGALAIGVGDVVLALENAVYSVISPEGCVVDPVAIARRGAHRGRRDADDRRRPGRPRASSTRSSPSRARAPTPTMRPPPLRSRRRSSRPCAASPAATRPSCSRRAMLGCAAWAHISSGSRSARGRPGTPSLRRRIGRILHLPGVPRRPRWSEIWPSDDSDDESERGA